MLNPQTLETFLRYLHITQAFDYRAKQLQKVGIIGTFPSSAGQEHFFLSLAMNMNPMIGIVHTIETSCLNLQRHAD